MSISREGGGRDCSAGSVAVEIVNGDHARSFTFAPPPFSIFSGWWWEGFVRKKCIEWMAKRRSTAQLYYEGEGQRT